MLLVEGGEGVKVGQFYLEQKMGNATFTKILNISTGHIVKIWSIVKIGSGNTGAVNLYLSVLLLFVLSSDSWKMP